VARIMKLKRDILAGQANYCGITVCPESRLSLIESNSCANYCATVAPCNRTEKEPALYIQNNFLVHSMDSSTVIVVNLLIILGFIYFILLQYYTVFIIIIV